MARVSDREIGRRQLAFVKGYGPEPMPKSEQEIIKNDFRLGGYLNWYNYVKSSDDAKKYVIKANPKNSSNIRAIPSGELTTIGWIFKLQKNGFVIDTELMDKIQNKLGGLINKYQKSSVEETLVETETSTPVADNKQMSPAKRIKRRNSFLIAELEEIVDNWIRDDKFKFDFRNWFVKMNVSAPNAKAIIARYAAWGEEEKFIADIVKQANNRLVVKIASRKARKKKVKPVTDLVKAFKFKLNDTTLGLKSVASEQIVGSTEVWTYQVDKRLLNKYVAEKDKTLSIKGTTILNYDEKASVNKKVRKPEVIKTLNDAGKREIRKFYDGIKAKDGEPSSRTSAETIILRVFK